MILIALMWAYILSPFSKHGDPPTTLKDATFTAAAEQACTTAEADIAKLPKAETAESPEQRAEVLTEANAIVADLVQSLRAIEPKVEQDRQFTDQWLADWDSYARVEAGVRAAARRGQGRALRGASRGRASDHGTDGRLRAAQRHAVLSGAARRLSARHSDAQARGHPDPSHSRIGFAGAPAATQLSGSSPETTDPAATAT